MEDDFKEQSLESFHLWKQKVSTNFLQVVCDSHEFGDVVMTTSNGNTSTWSQCLKCGCAMTISDKNVQGSDTTEAEKTNTAD